MRRKFIPVLIVGVTVLAAYVAVRAYIRHFETELTERKMARVTTGVVLDKNRCNSVLIRLNIQDDEGRIVHLEDWRKKSGETPHSLQNK
jgi:hypothetical protein